MRSDRQQALIRETQTTWQVHYPHPLSEDEAQQIIANTAALFNLLAVWDQHFNATGNDEPEAENTIEDKHAA